MSVGLIMQLRNLNGTMNYYSIAVILIQLFKHPLNGPVVIESVRELHFVL